MNVTGPAPDAPVPDGPVPHAYVLRRVHEALGTDPRVGEFGLTLELVAFELTVRGCLGTSQRKAGVIPVVTEVLSELSCSVSIRDLTEVTPNGPPIDEEKLT
jgi:hypothetical protein